MARDPRPYVPESRDLSRVAPGLRAKVEAVVAEMTAAGFDPLVFECVRTAERQWWIYGQGRTRAQCRAAGVPEQYAWPQGPICTNAASHTSSVHGHGLAVDIISKSKKWGAPAAFWSALGRAAERHGLTWGGTWRRPHDPPHIQWRLVRGGVAYAGPSAADRERTATRGMQATWRAYGADTTPASISAPATPTALPRAA